MQRRLLTVLLHFLVLILPTEGSAAFANHAQIKTSAHGLRDTYDYVVIGGGTSGLVVANRLSEDPTKSVLVVELGYLADESCIWMPRRVTSCPQHYFNETTVPQPGLLDSSMTYRVGAVVGGSSAVNGLVLDRATRVDYDAWAELGNPGWDWDGLYDYFKKSANFTPPSQHIAERYGYTWDESAYGGGPIHASYAPFQWETTGIMFDAWTDLNITGPKEHAFGYGIGRLWFPNSQHPENQTRSYARYGYYDPIQHRTNYHLLVGHKAEKLILTGSSADGVVIYQRDNPAEKFTVKASNEVIVAAGAVHTPQILQLSGIGPKELLDAAGISTKVDLPGVGHNFQDHPQVTLNCTFTNDLWPNPATLVQNETFAAAALAEYNANKTGPYTLGLGNAITFLPLSEFHPSASLFVSKLDEQSPTAYLAPDSPPSVVAGFSAQKDILSKLYASPESAQYESPFSGTCPRTVIMQHPLSRGTIHINASNPFGPPVIDFRVFSNPLDVELAIASLNFTRSYINTPTLSILGPIETGPGPNVSAEDTAAMTEYLRRTSGPTSFHACGTAAMLPRELGGVVGSDLKVYGVDKLSVVDASIFPLIVGAHLSATVYAVAEKAADIIKARAGS